MISHLTSYVRTYVYQRQEEKRSTINSCHIVQVIFPNLCYTEAYYLSPTLQHSEINEHSFRNKGGGKQSTVNTLISAHSRNYV